MEMGSYARHKINFPLFSSDLMFYKLNYTQQIDEPLWLCVP